MNTNLHLLGEFIGVGTFDLFYLLPEIFLLLNVLLLTLYFSFGFGRYVHNYFFNVSFLYTNLILFFAFILALHVSNKLSMNLIEPAEGFTHVFIFNGYLAYNNYILFFRPFIIFMAFLCCLISNFYFKLSTSGSFEYPLLIILSVIGSSLLISSFNLISFFLSMELTSYCLFTLASLTYNSTYSVEAGIKYFFQSCVASAFYLFGSSLFFLNSGSLSFYQISDTLSYFFVKVNSGSIDPLELIIFSLAISFTLVLPFFKVAVVPNYFWIADVYEGAPMPVTAFFSIFIKLTMSIVLIRFLFTVFETVLYMLNCVFLVCGLLSVIIGTLAALTEQKLKRMLAFSSISHSGYILLALLPSTTTAIQSSLNYLIVYTITNIIIFAFLLICATVKKGLNNRYIVYITDLNLINRKTLSASVCFAIALLSFAGIPPFGGFFVKFNIFFELWSTGYTVTVILLIILNIISVFYYLRVIKCLLFSPNSKGEFTMGQGNWNFGFMLLAASFLIFYPFFSGYLNSILVYLFP